MVLLKRQKIVFQPLPERVAFYQQAANGQADTNSATSSKPTSQPQDGTGELDEEKKDEPLDPKHEVYYLHETGEVFLDYECVLPLLDTSRHFCSLPRARPRADETRHLPCLFHPLPNQILLDTHAVLQAEECVSLLLGVLSSLY